MLADDGSGQRSVTGRPLSEGQRGGRGSFYQDECAAEENRTLQTWQCHYSNVNQVALSISVQHLNMAEDPLVVIGTCQRQQQVMIPTHYFYLASVLSRAVINYLMFIPFSSSRLMHNEQFNQCIKCSNDDLDLESVTACV